MSISDRPFFPTRERPVGEQEANPPFAVQTDGRLPPVGEPAHTTLPKYRDEGFYKYRWLGGVQGAGATAGTVLFQGDLDFEAKSVVIFNASAHILRIDGMPVQVPANVENIVYNFWPAQPRAQVSVFTQGATGGEVWALYTEQIIPPTPFGSAGTAVTVSGTVAQNLTQIDGTPVVEGDDGDAQAGAGIQEVTVGLYNGATFDRWRDGQQTMAQSAAVVIASNQSNLPENLTQVGGAAVALGQTTMAASIPVVLPSNQAAIPVTESGTWTVQIGNTPNTTPIQVEIVPSVLTGGLSTQRFHATTATTGVIKASAGKLKAWSIMNTNAATRYLHIYNKATTPSLSVDTPIRTIAMPAGAGANIDLVDGEAFGTGLAWAVTTDAAAVPVTGGAAGDIIGNVDFL